MNQQRSAGFVADSSTCRKTLRWAGVETSTSVTSTTTFRNSRVRRGQIIMPHREQHRVGKPLVSSNCGVTLVRGVLTPLSLALVLSSGFVSLRNAALSIGGVGPNCVGDCDNSVAVTVDELIEGVSIALDTVSVTYTESELDLDFGADGSVEQHFATCTDVPATDKCITSVVGLCGACTAVGQCQRALSCLPCSRNCAGNTSRCSLSDAFVTLHERDLLTPGAGKREAGNVAELQPDSVPQEGVRVRTRLGANDR